MGGGAAKYPAPTAEERLLQQKQADLLGLQQQQLQQGVAEQRALSPYMYRQYGLTPQTDASGMLTGFSTDPQFDQIMGLNRDYQLAQAQFAPEQLAQQRELLPLQTDAMRQQLALQAQQGGYNLEQQRLQEMLRPELFREMGFTPTLDAEGKITGLERTAGEWGERGQEIQRLQEERSLAALRGELPTDPALLRDLQQRETLKREELRRQLGGQGYATTTAGSEALGRFEEARAMTLDEARRKDLTMAESLGLARQQGNLSQDQYRTGLMQSVKPTSWMQAPQLGGVGGTGGGGNAFGGLAGLPGATAGMAGGFGDVFGGYEQVMGQLGQWRGNQFQGNVAKQQQQQANNQLYGSMAATSAMVAAVAASSRTLKSDITPMRPADESRTLGELMGEY